MKKEVGIKKEVRQMLQALLFSKDLNAGLLAYEIIAGKCELDKIPERLKELKQEATKIFWAYVCEGNLKQAIATANEENEYQLKNIQAYQMLQALLACAHKETRKIATEILAGEVSIKQAAAMPYGDFFRCVLNNDYKGAVTYASKQQREALNNVTKREYSFTLTGPQNLQRLMFLSTHFDLTIDEIVNSMVKAYYETVRADEHAESLQKEKPQNYFI